MSDIFKDKDSKEGNSVMDKLVTEVSQLLELVTVIAEYAVELWWDKHKQVTSKSHGHTQNMEM